MAIKQIEEKLDPDLINNNPNLNLSMKLRCAQKGLRKAKREADKLRQQHLEQLFNQALATNQAKHLMALKYLIRAECN